MVEHKHTSANIHTDSYTQAYPKHEEDNQKLTLTKAAHCMQDNHMIDALDVTEQTSIETERSELCSHESAIMLFKR